MQKNKALNNKIGKTKSNLSAIHIDRKSNQNVEKIILSILPYKTK